MRKKFLLLGFCLVATFAIQAKELEDVFKEGTFWDCVALGDDVILPDNYGVSVTYELRAPIDINGYSYLPLFELREGQSKELFGLRNDSGKKYAISLTNQEIGEKLIYNFSLQPGENCEIYDSALVDNVDQSPMLIECVSVEDFENSDISHQYMYLNLFDRNSDGTYKDSGTEIKWLRGIGSAYAGISKNIYECWIGGSLALQTTVCEGEVVYQSSKAADIKTITDNNLAIEGDRVSYYTLDGKKINYPSSPGIYVKRTILKDGNSFSEKVVAK